MRGSALQVGARIGDYQLERELGKGAMGAVFLARHVDLDAEYTLKVQLLGGGSNAHQRGERFAREARALAKVDRHPGIVGIHHYGLVPSDERISYCVLDLVDGSDLAEFVSTRQLELAEVLRWGAQIAQALAHVHAAGVVHRDLKPANILIRSEDGAALLTDFGLARDASEEQRLTVTGQMLGTLHYMAPEQITGQNREVGPHTDVFAFGAVLFELLTGRTPFDAADNLVQLSAQVVAGNRTPPSAERRDVPPDLDEVVLRALEAEPDERPTAEQIAEALACIARDEPIGWERRASSVTSGVRSWASRVRRREPRTLVQLIAIVVLASLVVGLALYQLAVERPRALALEVLSAHLSWEEQALTPLRLGVQPGKAPALAELTRRLDALEHIAARVPRAEVEPALARLRALHRWRAFKAGETSDVPKTPDGREPVDLVVDALILRDGGDLAGASVRAERAGASPAARLLRLDLLGRRRPQALLATLPGLEGEEAEFARRIAPRALRLRWQQLIAGVSDSDVEQLEDALPLLAQTATLAEKELPSVKRAALEKVAGAWRRRLGTATTAEQELKELEHLAGLVSTPPHTTPGPLLRSVLAERLGVRLRAALGGLERNKPGCYSAALSALRLERILFWRVEARLWTPEPMQAVLNHLAFSEQAHRRVSVELLLACVRHGIRGNVEKIAEKLPSGLPTLSPESPRGRALAFCRLLKRHLQDKNRWRALRRRGGLALAKRKQRAAELERFLAQSIGPEILPRYWGELWHELSSLLDYMCRYAKGPQQRQLATRLVRACQRERALRSPYPDASDLFDTCAREAYGHRVLGERAAVKAVWTWASDTLRKQLGDTTSSDYTLIQPYARSLHQLVMIRWSLGERGEELTRLAETSLDYGEKSPGDRWFLHFPAGWLTLRSLEAGRPQRAWSFAQRALPEGLGFPLFARHAVRAAAAAGKPKLARELLRKALAKTPRNKKLLRLDRELGGD